MADAEANKDWDIQWVDAGREPQVAPNPKYPDGIDVDIARSAPRACTVALPYPAKRCGAYRVHCKVCGFRAVVTTAGRPDDPRSVRLPCLNTNRGH